MSEPTIKDEAKQRHTEPLLPIERKLIGWKSWPRRRVADHTGGAESFLSVIASARKTTALVDYIRQLCRLNPLGLPDP